MRIVVHTDYEFFKIHNPLIRFVSHLGMGQPVCWRHNVKHIVDHLKLEELVGLSLNTRRDVR